jgi:hypothetical protein
MKKAFYHSPLVAALMVEQFDMLVVEECGQIHNDSDSILESRIDRHHRGKFYIHPDSLKILEPQTGDLCISAGQWKLVTKVHERHFDYAAYDGGWGWARMRLVGDPETLYARILQRGGKPFYWPEWEN